jgi:hypothetical protein
MSRDAGDIAGALNYVEQLAGLMPIDRNVDNLIEDPSWR